MIQQHPKSYLRISFVSQPPIWQIHHHRIVESQLTFPRQLHDRRSHIDFGNGTDIIQIIHLCRTFIKASASSTGSCQKPSISADRRTDCAGPTLPCGSFQLFLHPNRQFPVGSFPLNCFWVSWIAFHFILPFATIWIYFSVIFHNPFPARKNKAPISTDKGNASRG